MATADPYGIATRRTSNGNRRSLRDDNKKGNNRGD
jgi:hypothetical protein